MDHEIEHGNSDIDSAQLSQELRTALTVARGYAELMRRHLATPNPDLPHIAAMNETLLSQLLRLEVTISVTLDDPSHRPSGKHAKDLAPRIAVRQRHPTTGPCRTAKARLSATKSLGHKGKSIIVFNLVTI